MTDVIYAHVRCKNCGIKFETKLDKKACICPNCNIENELNIKKEKKPNFSMFYNHSKKTNRCKKKNGKWVAIGTKFV